MSEAKNLIKLVLLGIGAVGKSCVSIRFVQGHFMEEYEPTIEDNYRKTLKVDDVIYTLDIFDTAGMEISSNSLKASVIHNADVFMLIYSVQDSDSFEQITKIHEDIIRIRETEKFPCIICANKQDLDKSQHVVSESEGQELAKQLKAIYMPTSAKTGLNINEIMEIAVREVVKTREPVKPKKKWCLLI